MEEAKFKVATADESSEVRPCSLKAPKSSSSTTSGTRGLTGSDMSGVEKGLAYFGDRLAVIIGSAKDR
jgi:hypothetical protein